MKKTKVLISKLLAEIEKTGIIQIACDKHGISRNTFYRWMKEDKEFLRQASQAIALGVGSVNDVAISNILNGIKAKDMKATTFWLIHRHPEFRRPYVHRVDSEDPISFERSVAEGVRKHDLRKSIERQEQHYDEEEKKQRMEEYRAFEKRWQSAIEKGNQERAQKLFEVWKKEYLETGKEPPEIT